MKSISACIAICVFACLAGACKKNSSPSPAPDKKSDTVTIDTAVITFYINGVLFNWQSPNDSPATSTRPDESINVASSLQAGAPSVYELSAYIGGQPVGSPSYSLALFINAPIHPLTAGTYSLILYTSEDQLLLSATAGNFTSPDYSFGLFPGQWGTFVSDTVTITKISNGYADGTFSATLDSSGTNTPVLHITNGSFQNIYVSP
jgi:hypothetical protein